MRNLSCILLFFCCLTSAFAQNSLRLHGGVGLQSNLNQTALTPVELKLMWNVPGYIEAGIYASYSIGLSQHNTLGENCSLCPGLKEQIPFGTIIRYRSLEAKEEEMQFVLEVRSIIFAHRHFRAAMGVQFEKSGALASGMLYFKPSGEYGLHLSFDLISELK